MVLFKVLFSILLALELFGLSSPVLAQINQTRKQIIVIDPGHGGRDSGAVGLNGILEKDVVLNIAKQMVDLNETAFKNQFEIYLTRYKDTLISLGDRTKLAKILKADVFISFQKGLKENIGFKSRGVKFGDFQVLRETVNECSPILLEMGFLSNKYEANFLKIGKNTFSIASKILEFLNQKT